MKKRIPAFILMLSLFLTGAFAANAYKKSIEVEYGISVAFNNRSLSMTDVNGSPVQAFVYQGTTYVPIRAISNAFGSDIFYDDTENVAYIYNDFSEICAVVNEMENIATDYYLLVNNELMTLALKNFSDDSSNVNAMHDRVDAMYDSLSFLASDDGYNVNIPIIVDEITPSFSELTVSCATATTAYAAFCKNNSSYNLNDFIDKAEVVISNYYKAQNAFDSFYSSYCSWRNIGF